MGMSEHVATSTCHNLHPFVCSPDGIEVEGLELRLGGGFAEEWNVRIEVLLLFGLILLELLEPQEGQASRLIGNLGERLETLGIAGGFLLKLLVLLDNFLGTLRGVCQLLDELLLLLAFALSLLVEFLEIRVLLVDLDLFLVLFLLVVKPIFDCLGQL